MARLREQREQFNYQAPIIKRFMSDGEWKEFRKEYLSSRKGQGGRNRFTFFQMPITREQKEIAKFYLTDGETTVKEYAEEIGTERGYVYNVAKSTVIRIFYQHPELIDRYL